MARGHHFSCSNKKDNQCHIICAVETLTSEIVYKIKLKLQCVEVVDMNSLRMKTMHELIIQLGNCIKLIKLKASNQTRSRRVPRSRSGFGKTVGSVHCRR